jgi:hypothetical protein
LSIVLCMRIVGTRVSQGWLEAQTDYTDKTVGRALAYLREVGMVDHTSAGWQLAGQAERPGRYYPVSAEVRR